MADLSLDEYITMKIPNVQFSKRLGQKVSPGKANLKITTKNQVQNRNKTSPQFRVVGLGTVGARFDARQKLSRQQSKLQVKDAREKIVQKAKLVDARVRIQKRIGTQGQTVKKAVTSLAAAGLQSNAPTVQIKGSITPTKPVDARQMIKIKQQSRVKGEVQLQRSFQAQSQAVSMVQSNPKVTVTGLGRVVGQQKSDEQLSGIAGGGGTSIVRRMGGNLQKVIPNNQSQFGSNQGALSVQRSVAVRKTIENINYVPAPSSRVGNNTVVSSQAPQVVRHQLVTASPQDYDNFSDISFEETKLPSYQQRAQYETMGSDVGVVHVQNDVYQQSQPVNVLDHQASQPTYEQSYYADPEPSMPAVISAPPAPARTQLNRTARVSQTTSTLSQVQSRLGDDPNTVSSVQEISPLQGYRVLITNLHHIVTQDDILELFGAVGALKKVRLLRAGTAEVVFVKKEDALAAIRKYNNRELDGQPMKVVLTSGSSLQAVRPTSQSANLDISRLQKGNTSETSSTPLPVAEVDLSLLHKALFKTTSKDEPPSRPVTFTVKI